MHQHARHRQASLLRRNQITPDRDMHALPREKACGGRGWRPSLGVAASTTTAAGGDIVTSPRLFSPTHPNSPRVFSLRVHSPLCSISQSAEKLPPGSSYQLPRFDVRSLSPCRWSCPWLQAGSGKKHKHTANIYRPRTSLPFPNTQLRAPFGSGSDLICCAGKQRHRENTRDQRRGSEAAGGSD